MSEYAHTFEFLCRWCTINRGRKSVWNGYKASNYGNQENSYLQLVGEPENENDPNAIKVMIRGEMFGLGGYVGKEFIEETEET